MEGKVKLMGVGYIFLWRKKLYLRPSMRINFCDRQTDVRKDSASVGRNEKTKFISGQRVAKARALAVHLVMRNESSG